MPQILFLDKLCLLKVVINNIVVYAVSLIKAGISIVMIGKLYTCGLFLCFLVTQSSRRFFRVAKVALNLLWSYVCGITTCVFQHSLKVHATQQKWSVDDILCVVFPRVKCL